MNRKPDLTVVIPSYHEEENLRVILPRLKTVLEELGISYEVLVVDTMVPNDKSGEVCRQNQLSYINREGDDSYGSAVVTGIKHASGDKLLFMDADGSHSPEFVKELYSHMEGNDIVVASRYIDGGYTENSRILIFMSWVVNFIYGVVLGIQCKDISNSFKIYRADQLKALKLNCKNFDVVEEIFFKLIRSNKDLRVKEIPFTFKQRMFGNTKRNLWAFIFTYFFTLIKLRFSK